MLRTTIFILIGIMLFLSIQYVLTPDWSTVDNIAYTLQGLDRIKKDTIDVFFLGSSHMVYGMSPLKIYEDTGICSYSLALSAQPLPVSYYCLKEALKNQSPSIVVLDASGLFYNGGMEKAAWRYLTDNLGRWPPNIEIATEYSEQYADEGVLSVLVPLLKYHSSWTNISPKIKDMKEDDDIYYSAGEYVYSRVDSSGLTLEAMNDEANNRAAMNRGIARYIDHNEYGEQEIDSVVYAPEIGEYEREWLLKIKRLCDENNAQVLLTKIPTRMSSSIYSSAWTEIRSDMVRSLAEDVNIPYFDLVYDVESQVNFTTDTCDGGKHLNIRGAEKDAVALGLYLMENYDIESQDNAQFNAALEKYRKVREVALLQSETNFELYLDRLIESLDKWTVLISVQDEYTAGLSEDDHIRFQEMGLKLISEGDFQNSYLSVIHSGEVEHEEVSDRKIEYSTKIDDVVVEMKSSGWLTGPMVSISLNGEDYAFHNRGLNIVVIDDETGLVIDSVDFDTLQGTKPFSRNWTNINNYLRAYETAVCFE